MHFRLQIQCAASSVQEPTQLCPLNALRAIFRATFCLNLYYNRKIIVKLSHIYLRWKQMHRDADPACKQHALTSSLQVKISNETTLD
jgi:hypothetical protein